MSGGMETTAKMFGLSTLVCPNCNLILSDSEAITMQAGGPVPLCFKCRALVSATTKKEYYCKYCKEQLFDTPESEGWYRNEEEKDYFHLKCAKEAEEHDPVNHPKHYTTHPSGIECIQITRHMNFNCGNAIKYIWRAGEKGNTIEDLKKAVWYLNDEITRLEKKGN